MKKPAPSPKRSPQPKNWSAIAAVLTAVASILTGLSQLVKVAWEVFKGWS